MKYCINYKKNFKYINEIDELTINYNRKDTSLQDFLLLFKDKRINIYIEDSKSFLENNDLNRFIEIKNKYPSLNFYFKLRNPAIDKDSLLLFKKIKEKTSIPYFFEVFINDWDILYGYINMKVSDIYIAEALCFELDKVSPLLHNHGIKIRTFPNVCQTSWKETPPLKTFFIRPEDVDIYSNYIDTLEFFSNLSSIETLYKIYAIDQKWFGKLAELITGFNSTIDNKFIAPNFAERRINCNKKCLKGGKCDICNKIETLSKVLEKNNLLFKIN